MKQLILVRHAKSSWDDDTSDVDRPLAGRGERDAPRMGKRLKARHARPELIVTSHAARALAPAPPTPGRPDKRTRRLLLRARDRR